MAFYANAPLPDTNARQVAQTIRMPSTALLTIDSEDRYTDYASARASVSSPYNFTISKTESLMPGFMTRVGVSEVNFPWAIPNINLKSRTMNCSISRNGDTLINFVIALPIGFYTPSQLAAAVQANVIFNSPTSTAFTMTYGQPLAAGKYGAVGITPIFQYATNLGTDVISFSPMLPNSAAYPYSAQSKQLFDVLGFTNAQFIFPPPVPPAPPVLGLASGAGVFTFCQSIRYVDIVCNQLTNSQAQKDQTSQPVARDMLCRIYLGNGAGDGQSTVSPSVAGFCPPGCEPTTIYRNYTTPKQIQWIPNQNIPGFLQFQVYDDAGDLLDTSLVFPGTVGSPDIFQPGYTTGQFLDWSMTMLVSEN
jgi:hypothetical protein